MARYEFEEKVADNISDLRRKIEEATEKAWTYSKGEDAWASEKTEKCLELIEELKQTLNAFEAALDEVGNNIESLEEELESNIF